MNRKGAAKSGRWNGSGRLLPGEEEEEGEGEAEAEESADSVGAGDSATGAVDSEEPDSLKDASADSVAGAARSRCRVTTADGSTVTRSPGRSFRFGSVICRRA